MPSQTIAYFFGSQQIKHICCLGLQTRLFFFFFFIFVSPPPKFLVFFLSSRGTWSQSAGSTDFIWSQEVAWAVQIHCCEKINQGSNLRLFSNRYWAVVASQHYWAWRKLSDSRQITRSQKWALRFWLYHLAKGCKATLLVISPQSQAARQYPAAATICLFVSARWLKRAGASARMGLLPSVVRLALPCPSTQPQEASKNSTILMTSMPGRAGFKGSNYLC